MKMSVRFIQISLVSLALAIGAVLGHFVSKRRAPTDTQIQLVMDSQTKNCVQISSVMGDATHPKVDHTGGHITWVASSATSTDCKIEFNNTPTDCPFYSHYSQRCTYICGKNGDVTSDSAFGRDTETFTYSNVTIGGNPCHVNGNGIVLDH